MKNVKSHALRGVSEHQPKPTVGSAQVVGGLLGLLISGYIIYYVGHYAYSWIAAPVPVVEAAVTDEPIVRPKSERTFAFHNTCGMINGLTPKDLQHVELFCDLLPVETKEAVDGIPRATDTILYISVTRPFAYALMQDKLAGEQIVLSLMKIWKKACGDTKVTIYFKYGDVEVARGDFKMFGGDQVTIK